MKSATEHTPILAASKQEEDEKANTEMPDDKPGVSRTVYLLTFCAALGSCNLGFDIGVNTDAGKLVQESMQLSDVQLELFMGSINLYAIVGALLTSKVVGSIGLRLSFLASSVLFVVGLALQIFSSTFLLLMFGRVWVGIAVGFGMTVTPMYITEISPKRARGALVSWSEIGLNVGILLGFSSGLLFFGLSPDTSWRLMFSLGCFLPILLAILAMTTMEESPRWLIQKGRYTEARVVLVKLYPRGDGVDSVDDLLREIKEDIEEEVDAERGQSGWAAILCSDRPAIRRMMLVGVSIGICVQLSGIDAIQYYLTFVLDASGITSRKKQAVFLTGLGVLKLSMIFVASLLVDKLGRRPLLFLSLSGAIVSLLLIASVFGGDDDNARVVLFGLGMYLASFSLGLGPLAWIVPNELFPTAIRAKAVSLSVFANRLSAAVVSSTMLTLADFLGWCGYFVFLAVLCFLILAFFYVYLPETKGKRLEDIAHYMEEITASRHKDTPVSQSTFLSHRESSAGIEILA